MSTTLDTSSGFGSTTEADGSATETTEDCAPGTRGCPCNDDATCDGNLVCDDDDTCVKPPPPGSDTSTSTGEASDTSTSSGEVSTSSSDSSDDGNAPVCGNGKLEPGEACDDGNAIDADGCEADCTLPACANGIADPGELCLGPLDPLIDLAAAESMAVGDMDRDGDDDIVVASRLEQTIHVLLVDGKQVTRHDSKAVDGLPQRLRVADANGDAFPDAVYLKRGAAVEMLPNLGDGQLDEARTLLSSPQVQSFELGHFDRDGKLDYVVVDHITASASTTATVSVYVGNGAGGWSAGGQLSVPDQPKSVAMADLDGESLTEIVLPTKTMHPGVRTYSSFPGMGLWERGYSQLAGLIDEVYTADLDGDGFTDIIAKLEALPEIDIAYGDGEAGFSATDILEFDVPLRCVALGDIDGDGDVDLVAADAFEMFLYENDGSGGFERIQSWGLRAAPGQILVHDLDGDALADILVTLPSGNEIGIIRNTP